MALLNRFNFLVWQQQTPPEPEHLHVLPEGSPIGKMTASVIIVPGEAYSFFINTTADLPVHASLSINLYTDKLQLRRAGIGSLTAVVVDPDTGRKQYLAQMTGPVNLPEGYYRLQISAEVQGISYFSNRVWYRPSGYETSSALFSFRNRRSVANIPYEHLDMGDFRNVLRLKCYLDGVQTDTEIEDYRAISTGQHKAVMITEDLVTSFQTGYCDLIGHEGWSSLLKHRDLLINRKAYSLKTGYQIDSGGQLKLSNGGFELFQSEFSEVNRC